MEPNGSYIGDEAQSNPSMLTLRRPIVPGIGMDQKDRCIGDEAQSNPGVLTVAERKLEPPERVELLAWRVDFQERL
eukprot:11085614-Lingulodinium_polyedra.AAC.1